MISRAHQFFITWQGVAAFIFFAASLCLPSGYSWGAALASCLAIVSFPFWRKKTITKTAWLMAICFGVFGFFWSHSFDDFWSWNGSDYWLKYALAAICLLCASVIPVPINALRFGFIFGGIFSGLIAIYQFPLMGRAHGYTNAIQFGDIALLLAVANFAFAVVRKGCWAERLAFLVAGCLAMSASFMSLSRGGWILILVMPILFSLLSSSVKKRAQIFLSILFGGCILFLLVMNISIFSQRVKIVQSEVNAYLDSPSTHATTSAGQRLEQWRLAWQMGKEKPLTGWGNEGLIIGKEKYVKAGYAHPSVLLYGHAHSEFLDTWARRGTLGVSILLLIYLLPFYVFYPTAERASRVEPGNCGLWRSFCMIGLSVPVGYFIFGITQVFFSHNSGHMFYLFAIVFLFSAMKSLELDVAEKS